MASVGKNARRKSRVLTWPEIRDLFLEIAKEYPGLSAQWREMYHVWILRPDLKDLAAGDFGLTSDKFKAAATQAIIQLRKKSRFQEPWQLFLDLLRSHLQSQGLGDRYDPESADPDEPVLRSVYGEPGRYTDYGSPIYASAKELRLMRETRGSLYSVRQKNGYTTGDEWKTDGNHLMGDDVLPAFDGIIAGLPRTCADYCQFLESPGNDSKARAALERQKFMAPHIAPISGKPTLNHLADNLGIEQSSFSRWHRGLSRLNEPNLQLLANHLKIDAKNIPNNLD